VSQRLDMHEFSFVNPDPTVTLFRSVEGRERIGLAARTNLDGSRIGVADTGLYDERGPIGRGVLTPIVRRRRGRSCEALNSR